jgi:uncharacterized protein (TIGR03083 family)
MGVGEDLSRERRAFVDTVVALGPDAPSACGAWTSQDLAVHVVTGELGRGVMVVAARWLVGHGVRVDRLGRINNRVLGSYRRRHDVDWALARLDRPPPRLHRHGTVAAVSLLEVWAHHEDLLLANDVGPCRSGIDLVPVMKVLVRYQRGLLKQHAVRVASAGTVWHEPRTTARVRVDGTIDDLARWLAGRAGLDRLTVSGDAAALSSERPRL